jgi:hypothetical protein
LIFRLNDCIHTALAEFNNASVSAKYTLVVFAKNGFQSVYTGLCAVVVTNFFHIISSSNPTNSQTFAVNLNVSVIQ